MALTYRAVTGALTTAYGLACLTRPATLLNPARLPATRQNVALTRAVGLRDTISGVAMIAAPTHLADRAVAARVMADASDVIVFGIICPRSAKAKAAGVAAAWGALCSLPLPVVATHLPPAVQRWVRG